MMKHLVILVILVVNKIEVNSVSIEKKIENYFSSASVKSFYDGWQKQRRSFETAVAQNLKESHGTNGGTMNVYVRQETDPQEIAQGYFFTDNVVIVLLLNMYLREMPHILLPDVSFPLAHNVIRLETPLNKMFIDAEYVLCRNKTEIVFESQDDKYKYSPFSFQQVQNDGLITIIAEDCHMIGEAVVTLTGVTPHIGQSNFRVVNCKFSVEIYQPGLPSPPIIAPYFSREQKRDIQRLMSGALNEEMAVKMQGAVVSLINTTAIFARDMVKFRHAQKKIFKETEDYLTLVVRHLNKAIIQENQGIVGMDPLEFMFDDAKEDGKSSPTYARIAAATINGLDLAYASKRGGPIKMSDIMIVDEIRFYRLQIRGKLYFENTTTKGVYDFAVELVDVPVAIKIYLDGKQKRANDNKYLVRQWRDIAFSIIDMKLYFKDRVKAQSLIVGYLVNEIPKTITKYLNSVFEESVKNAEKDDDRRNYEKGKESGRPIDFGDKGSGEKEKNVIVNNEDTDNENDIDRKKH